MQQFLDDNPSPKRRGFRQQLRIESESASRGAAPPLPGHRADVNLVRPYLDSPSPLVNFGAEHIARDGLLKPFPPAVRLSHAVALRSIRSMPVASSTMSSAPASISALY